MSGYSTRDLERILDAEAWLARRLEIADLWRGVTTVIDRRERIREAICSQGLHLGGVIAGRNPKTGRVETWAALFKRVYGEPVE